MTACVTAYYKEWHSAARSRRGRTYVRIRGRSDRDVERRGTNASKLKAVNDFCSRQTELTYLSLVGTNDPCRKIERPLVTEVKVLPPLVVELQINNQRREREIET